MGFLSDLADFATFDVFDFNNSKDPPAYVPPPPPANYYYYDADGNLDFSQEWNAEKNAYEFKAAPKTASEIAEEKQRNAMRRKYLSYLDQAPEDRVAAYEEYAKNFSEAVHKDVDLQYGKTQRVISEDFNARGLTGSRAEVDANVELAKQKGDIDVNIGVQSALAKETLAAADREHYLNVLSYLDAQRDLSDVRALQKAGIASSNARLGTAQNLAINTLQNDWNYNTWLNRVAMDQQSMRTFADTATGIAFLYGYNRGGVKPQPLNQSNITPNNRITNRYHL